MKALANIDEATVIVGTAATHPLRRSRDSSCHSAHSRERRVLVTEERSGPVSPAGWRSEAWTMRWARASSERVEPQPRVN